MESAYLVLLAVHLIQDRSKIDETLDLDCLPPPKMLCCLCPLLTFLLLSVNCLQEMSKIDETLDVDSLPPPNILGTMADVPCNHTHH